MPNSSLPPPHWARSKSRLARFALAQGRTIPICCILLLLAASASAQTLARPGLAGSGLNTDPWWMHAVFYRTGERVAGSATPALQSFDYKALTAKLDALQSVGIDALVVPMPQSPAQPTAQNAPASTTPDAEPPMHDAALDDFDELIHQASSRGIRVLLTFPASGLTADLPSVAQLWLNHGIAGFHVVTPLPTTPQETQAIVAALRKVTNAAVGQRIVLSDFEPDWSDYDPKTQRWVVHPTPLAPRARSGLADPTAPQLQIDSSLKRLTVPDASSLRSLVELSLDLSQVPPSLLLDLRPPPPAKGAPDPYPALAMPIATIQLTTHPTALIDADLTAPDADEAAAHKTAAHSVTSPTPFSLADWYRQLSALHHSNAALRYGSVTVLNLDDQNALVWVRRVPSGTSAMHPVFVACNLSAVQVRLSLTDAVKGLNLRGSFLRTLLRSDQAMGPQDLNAVVLPPFGVYIGELGR